MEWKHRDGGDRGRPPVEIEEGQCRDDHCRGGVRPRDADASPARSGRDVRSPLLRVSQVARHVAHRRIPRRWILLQTTVRDPIEHRHRKRRRIGVDDPVHRVDLRIAAEDFLLRHRLVQHAAEREHVGAVIDDRAGQLLRRDVADGADDRSRRRGERRRDRVVHLAGGRHRFRQSEVDELRVAVVGDHHVLRLQIAMHDPVLVRAGEAVGDADQVADELRRVVVHVLAQARAADQLHRQVVHVPAIDGRAADVVDRDDGRMIECRGRACLALESHQRLGILCHRRRQHFDRHFARKARVSRSVDLAHSAAAEWGENFVRPEECAGSDCHGGVR
jgi:hypothetical protein